MQLITIENEYPIFNPEVRVIKEFSLLIKKCRPIGVSYEIANKEATKRLAFIFFMADWKSRYIIEYQEPIKRAKKLIHDLNIGKDFDISEEYVINALNKYNELNTTEASETLISAKNVVWKLRNYYDSVNFTERDNKGKLLFVPKEVQQSIEKLKGTISGLEALEKEVRKREEQANRGKIKGGGEKGSFEDPEVPTMLVINK